MKQLISRDKVLGRKTRRGASKSRFGCKTCKFRRIKCDEGKPSCFQCTRTDRVCDFLETNPKPANAMSIWNPENSKLYAQPNPTSGTHTSFEVQNLDYFHNICTQSFGEFYRDDFWEIKILRYMASNQAIRHAAIVVAALHRRLAFPNLGTTQDLVFSQRESFLSYNKAIQLISSDLADDPKSCDLACVASLLFITYEVFRGNDAGSVLHLEGALSILKTYLPTEKSRSAHQNDILNAFSRLEIQASGFSDDYGAKALLPPTIPPVFFSLLEARDALNAIIVLMHAYFDPHRNKYRTFPLLPLPSEISLNVEKIRLLLEDWLKSFELFILRTDILSSRNVIAVTQLRVSYQTTAILIATYYNCYQSSYDQYLPQFTDIVCWAASLSEYFYASSQHGGQRVAFDIGIIQPLNFVTLKCRDRGLRRKAIALVEQAGREGVWDGVSTAAVLRWVVDKEEENMEPFNTDGHEVCIPGTEVPVESDRLHRIEVKFQRLEKRTTIKGMKRSNVTDWDSWECVVGETSCWGPPKEAQEEGFQSVTAMFE